MRFAVCCYMPAPDQQLGFELVHSFCHCHGQFDAAFDLIDTHSTHARGSSSITAPAVVISPVELQDVAVSCWLTPIVIHVIDLLNG